MSKGLGKRQRRFIREKAAGKSDREAALAAGYAPSTALNSKQKLWRPRVLEAFRKALRRAIPEKLVVQRLREGIDAQLETTRVKKELGPDGKTVLSTEASREVLQHFSERRKYVELWADIMGLRRFPEQEEEPEAPLDLSGLTTDELETVVRILSRAGARRRR